MAIFMNNGTMFPNRSNNDYPDDEDCCAAYFIGLSGRGCDEPEQDEPDFVKEQRRRNEIFDRLGLVA